MSVAPYALRSRVNFQLGRSDAVALAFLVVCLVLGGGGSPWALVEVVLQVMLALLAGLWMWWVPRHQLGSVPWQAWCIAALLVVVPALQLVPLPPLWWHALSGRGDEVAALRLIGQGDSWRPLAMTPWRTLGSLLAMTAAAITIPMVASMPPSARTVAMACVVCVAGLSLVLGAGQVSGGYANIYRLYSADSAFLQGFQANHDSEADVLLIAIVFLAGIFADLARIFHDATSRGPLSREWRYGVVAVLAGTMVLVLGVVLTGSRTGMALLPLALLSQICILRSWLKLGGARAKWLALGVAGLLAIGATAMYASTPVHNAVGRFNSFDANRLNIWQDVRYAIGQYWPWGTGMGNFIPSFAAAESLEFVTEKYVNRAHDDYLELILEAGIPGIMAFIAVLGVFLTCVWRAFGREIQRYSAHLPSALAALAIIALHSLVDYPLRSMSLACVAAICVALAVTSSRDRGAVGKAKEWS